MLRWAAFTSLWTAAGLAGAIGCGQGGAVVAVAAPDGAPADADGGMPDRAELPEVADTAPPGEDAVPLPPAVVADGGSAPESFAAIFDSTILHRIDIRVDSQHLAQLDVDQEAASLHRGLRRHHPGNVGHPQEGRHRLAAPARRQARLQHQVQRVRQGAEAARAEQAAAQQRRPGPSFLHEHVAYEIARQAGAAAPLTAHGLAHLQRTALWALRGAGGDQRRLPQAQLRQGQRGRQPLRGRRVRSAARSPPS